MRGLPVGLGEPVIALGGDDFAHGLRIAAAHPGQTLVIVTHGGALDCLHRCATGQSLDAPRTWELRNAAINRVLVAEDRMSLVGWNDGGHLDSGLDETGA